MQVFCGGLSLRIYTLSFQLLTSLQLWGGLSASSSSIPPVTLPAPELLIHQESEESVVLVCRAPEGYHGLQFMLFRVRKMVDSQTLLSGAEEVQFPVRLKEGDSAQQKLYCCLYKDEDGHYSAFSPYLQLNDDADATPTNVTPSYPPPTLSVNPSSWMVNLGDVLSFSCSVPDQPQSQSESSIPVTFLLLRTGGRTGVTSVVPHPQASLVSNPAPQPGVFSVGPVRGQGEEGDYTCLYQISRRTGLVNSTVSNVVRITVRDPLPVPTLVLQQQTDVWHLLCTGSPAYPGALFSLYLADHDPPEDTYRATSAQHQASFPVPVQDSLLVLYQCQYSVLLGSDWSHSERSLPLPVTKGNPPPPSDVAAVDWPLLLGSFSAVVLFLCSVALVVVVARRKVKAAAEEKKKRQDAQFWTQVHAKDHVVDLTLRRASFTTVEWASADSDTAPRSPFWNSLSTFTTPIHPIH